MSMNRRDFSLASAALGLAAAAPVAFAQGAPFKAGEDYAVLRKPAPTDAPAGKVEVVEFFSYNCPHCATFEPGLEAWARGKMPANAVLRRVPVPFVGQREDVITKQKLYYALEAMGKLEELHMKVFQALHVERQRLFGDAAVLEWVGKQPGIDAKKFEDTFKSFGVAGKVQRAGQLTQAYDIPGTPAMGVAGRWYVDGEMGKSLSRMLQVCDYLIGQAAKG